MSKRQVLVGDVGGTNVRFAIGHRYKGQIQIEQFVKLEGDKFVTFYDALAEYLERTGVELTEASFALAGRVEGDEVTLTNREWHVSTAKLKSQFGFEDVTLMNDFAGMARAVPEQDMSTLELIKPGKAVKNRPILVAGLGTGLGVGTVMRVGRQWAIVSGEGGHVAFAPETPLEIELSQVMLKDPERDYVSAELVAAGVGLNVVYAAFCEIYGRTVEALTPQEMQERAKQGDQMFDDLIRLRAHTLMRIAGDMMMANGTSGGVVLAGGVTERILDYVKAEDAIARFTRRGMQRDYVAACPIHLMRDPMAPLIGATAYHFQSDA